jgi:3-oxoacid CoA-transferase subunit A
LNYYLDGDGPACNSYDIANKETAEDADCTLFCIHGNHEERPYNVPGYHEALFHGGIVYVQDDYPDILFAKDGEIYDFDGFKCLAIGGAYSVDKDFRLARGWHWFSSEQPDDAIKAHVEEVLKEQDGKVDVILSHTCPYRYIPREKFISGVDASTVDNSTELWLDEIEKNTFYKKWYCGHYHTDKRIDFVEFLFQQIVPFMHDVKLLDRTEE